MMVSRYQRGRVCWHKRKVSTFLENQRTGPVVFVNGCEGVASIVSYYIMITM